MAKTEQRFGGDWTIEKLTAVEEYCHQYTTALKRAPDPHRLFRLHFIDAFAGTGYVDIKSGEQAGERVIGSALRALRVVDRAFDRVHLIELNVSKARILRQNIKEHENRAHVVIGDANKETIKICETFDDGDRAVVLFDPASTQLDWSTVEAVANTRRCDVWILFPLGDVRRDLSRRVRPEKDSADGQRLTRILGTDSWYDRYSLVSGPERAEQAGLDPALTNPIAYGGNHWESPGGTDWVLDIYRESLARVFPSDLVLSREMTNSQNSVMFSLLFGCANPRGAQIANRIASGAISKAEREIEQLKHAKENPFLFG